jgi:cytochrome c-type biogenesis protein CcmE
MKKRHCIILVFIALFAIYALTEFSHSLNPYVSFAEAKTTKSTVQVKGTLLKDVSSITYEKQELRFLLRDEEGQQVQISYHGAKPDNFEHADSAVVIGKYDGEQFVAEKLLVKCPSKYEKKGTSS